MLGVETTTTLVAGSPLSEVWGPDPSGAAATTCAAGPMPRGSATPTCAMHTVAAPNVMVPAVTTAIANFASISLELRQQGCRPSVGSCVCHLFIGGMTAALNCEAVVTDRSCRCLASTEILCPI